MPLIHLYTKYKMKESIEKDLSQTKGENMTKPHGFRCTDEVWAIIVEKAQQCGLWPSEYIRMVATGHQPRQRLTVEELRAIDTLEGCRKQLQQFLNRVKGMTDVQRNQLFRDPQYYEQWKEYVEALIIELTNIRKNLKQKG